MKRWKKGWKRTAAILLAAILAVNPGNTSSFVAYAAAEETNVLVGDTYLYTETYYQTDEDGNITVGGTAEDYNVYLTEEDDNKYVLTLNNATIQGVDNINGVSGFDGAIYYNGYSGVLPIEIVLEGESTVTAGMMPSGNAAAIKIDGQELTIKGDGTLIARSDTYVDYNEGSENYASRAIWVIGTDSSGNACGMKIESGTVYALAGDAETYSYAIEVPGDVEITGGSLFVNVDANGEKIGGGSNTDVSAGIVSNNNVIITGGQVVVYGGEAADSSSCGIYARESIEISGGDIEVYGGDAANGSSYGIASEGDITINGTADVSANSGTAENGKSEGIGTESNLNISGSAKVTANGGSASENSYGIGVVGNLNISGEAEVTANGGLASEDSFGAGAEGNITIDGEATVTTTANKAENGDSQGLGTLGNLEIEGDAVVKTTGGTAQNGASRGAAAVGDITIGGDAEVEAKSGEAKTGSVGIVAVQNLSINGGEVNTVGGNSSNGESFGMGARGTLTIDSADVTAKSSKAVSGNSVGIGADGKIKIINSNITANGGEAPNGGSYGIASKAGVEITNNSTVNATSDEAKTSCGVGTEGDVEISDNSDVQATSGTATNGSSLGVGSKGNVSVADSNIKAVAGTANNGLSYGIGAEGTVGIDGSRYNLSGKMGPIGARRGCTITNSVDASLESETPVILPENVSTFTDSLEVKIVCSEHSDSDIYYTTDGTEPTTASTLYTSAFTITKTTTIKAIGVWENRTPSDVVTATYTKVADEDSDNTDDSDDTSDSDDMNNSDEDSYDDYDEDDYEEAASDEGTKLPVPYGYWRLDEIGWWFEYSAGGYAAGSIVTDEAGVSYELIKWEYINGAWFAFGADGYAKFGWVFDIALNGWFYVDVNAGMKTGWQMVDGKWYYLNPVSDGTMGKMYAATMTPDGYYVDESGAWVQ